MAFLSIITPTYNRAHTLTRCYESLLRQTCCDFEWIIVDDGSSDDTQSVVSEFRTDRFPVISIKKENGGKHTALNASHPFVHGDFVLILDSDDYLTETAVEEVLAAWAKYAQNEQVGIVTFLRGTPDRKPLCVVDDYNQPVEIMRYRRRHIVSSDCCEVLRAELFRMYPFPVYAGERFVSECALWDRVGIRYKCVYIPSVIYICEYLEGGLTRSGRPMRLKNPKGGMFTSNLRMDKRNYLTQRWKNGLLYTCYGCFAHESVFCQIKDSDYPLLTVACYPFGYGLYRIWKRKYFE